MGVSQFELDLVAQMPVLRRFALNLCHNSPEADDLVQETMLRALSSQDSFEAGTKLGAWLFTICRNYFNTQYRRIKRREQELSETIVDITPMDYPDPEAVVDATRTLRRLFDHLPPVDQRMAVLLCDERSYEELAEIEGVPDGTVKSRVSRFRERARTIVNRSDPLPSVKRKPNHAINRPKSWWDSLRRRNTAGKAAAATRAKNKAAMRVSVRVSLFDALEESRKVGKTLCGGNSSI